MSILPDACISSRFSANLINAITFHTGFYRSYAAASIYKFSEFSLEITGLIMKRVTQKNYASSQSDLK